MVKKYDFSKSYKKITPSPKKRLIPERILHVQSLLISGWVEKIRGVKLDNAGWADQIKAVFR